MPIFELIGRQHQATWRLLAETKRAIAAHQDEAALAAFQCASRELAIAIRVERSVLYPRLADVAGLVAEVALARADLDAIAEMLERLRLSGLRGIAWAVTIDKLATLVDRHAARSLVSLFPLVRIALTTRELDRLAVDLHAYLAWSRPVADVSITYEPPRPHRDRATAAATR